MKIKFVHQYFHPEIVGAAVRLTELAVGLKEKSFDISVLTSFPKSSDKKIASNEIYNGVLIERTSKIWFDKKNRFGRIFNAINFFLVSFFKVWNTSKDTILFIGSDPPFLPFLGWLINKIRGQTYVVLVFDIYPELAVQLGYLKPNSWFVRFWNWLDRLSLSSAKAIVVPGKYMKGNLLKKIKDEGAHSKIWVIPTWENGDLVQPLDKKQNWFAKQYDLLTRTIVLYSGNMGLAHELVNLIEAAEFLKEHDDIFFLFIGDGGQKKQLVSLAEEKKLTNIRFLPYQPSQTMPYSCTSGDISVITLKPEAKGLCIPTKFQTALASGQAILAIVPKESEIADLLDEEDCGIFVEPGSPEKIAQSILMLHQNPALISTFRHKARKVFERKFTKKQAVESYAELFRTVLNRNAEIAYHLL